MRYQVPQFIEVEDKVVGPLTIRQAIYVVGGAGMCFIFYTYLPIYISVFFIAAIACLSLALAFYKVNNKPFIDFLESAFTFYTKKNLYIWKKEEKKAVASEVKSTDTRQVYVPKLSDSRLKELSWSLDINENLNPVTNDDGQRTR
jgi:hypothetical protein